MNNIEIVLPTLYNTNEKPKDPSNYSVWIPLNVDGAYSQIYIGNKWFNFIRIVQDERIDNENNNKDISDLEFNIIKLLREYIKESKT